MKLPLVLSLLLVLAGPAVRAADLPPLNDPPTATTLPGKFIWADLFTTDPDAAVKFYTGLFGWTATPIDRGTHVYTVLSNGDRPVAGITRRSNRLPGESGGRWVGFVSVTDVARAVAAIKGQGGNVIVPPQDVAQRGTVGIVTDKDGSLLGLLQSSSGDPGDYLADPGDWAWVEIFARDAVAAAHAYHEALGYDIVPDTRSSRKDVFVLASQGYARAGLAPVPSRPDAQPGWLGFVRVANVDDAVSKAVALGGHILVAPKPGKIASRVAIIADPVGGSIGVMELSDPSDTRQVP